MSGKVAVSDLHNRLDYLVAYSSELVFVANDDLQFQQTTLQSFIAQQNENLEVAFLKGEAGRSEEDYRKEICRQILHQTTGQFDGSLRTALQDLEGVQNPILICLYSSQHLPQRLLEEMWELVLLARTLNKNLHVNVLLFGNTKWAVNAKALLPANKGNKPVLLRTYFYSTELSSVGIKVAETEGLSELDALIANKRAAFAERVQARSSVNSPQENKPTLIQTGKFQIVIGLVFLATFAAIVFWFYPQQTEQATSAPTESSPPIISDNKTQIELPTEKLDPELEELDPIEAVEAVETAEIDETSESLLESPIEPMVDQLLVTQWDSSEPAEPENELELTAATEEPPLVAEVQSLEIQSPIGHPLEKVEQDQFLIQIIAMSNLRSAELFITDNSLQETTWIYTTVRFGGSWHVIVHKKLFQSRGEARAYIPSLSGQLITLSPFIKSIEEIQEEIAIAN